MEHVNITTYRDADGWGSISIVLQSNETEMKDLLRTILLSLPATVEVTLKSSKIEQSTITREDV